MKVVILAGGFGTRISEETTVKPKPMVEIGGKPILWHIMKLYSAYKINDFIICLGYKGYLIKEYFANYFLHMSDVTFDMEHNTMHVHEKHAEPWKVTLIDTGEHTMTGGRLKRVEHYLHDSEDFCFTYGDGVSDVNVRDLIEFHRSQGTKATLTAVQPPGRFGSVDLQRSRVVSFVEKPQGDGAWISGGFFVLSPKIFRLIRDDNTKWEDSPLKTIAAEGELSAYVHRGFWHPMDTLRDKNYLQKLWETGEAPWKRW